jgi:hypothetical protein
MNLSYKELIPSDFSGDSRVWIYQCNRRFTISEAIEIEEKLNEFTRNWKSHQVPVKGFGTLFFGQFIVLMADETESGVSGCSTDSSVRLIKSIEQSFNVGLFERTVLAFIIKDKLELLPISQLTYAFDNNFLNGETLFFNNNIENKNDLINNWIIPIKDSWISKRYSKSTI